MTAFRVRVIVTLAGAMVLFAGLPVPWTQPTVGRFLG
jgi:hypothetical protein